MNTNKIAGAILDSIDEVALIINTYFSVDSINRKGKDGSVLQF